MSRRENLITIMKRLRPSDRPPLAPADDLTRAIHQVLRTDPPEIKPEYADGIAQFDGHCYTASEAYFYLAMLGGKDLQPMQLVHRGVSHWWLLDEKGCVVDLTPGRRDRPVRGERPSYPYERGSKRAFRWTKEGPSARARHIMDRVQRGAVAKVLRQRERQARS